MFYGFFQSRQIKQMQQILNSDNRFLPCQPNHWKCIPLAEMIQDKPIKEVDFVITDIETTGSVKGKDRIIEIAAVKLRNDQEIDRFESLVKPDKKISRQISWLTGIKNVTVEEAPPVEDVLPRYVQFMEGAIFVAHNTLFDYFFINSEIRRLGLAEFENQMEICTFRMAKKILPDVRARGVSGLAKYFNYSLEGGRHRAMPDVLATRFYFEKFTTALAQQGITSLHKLIEFQKDKITQKKINKKLKSFRKNRSYPSIAHYWSSER
jgi:DNA polymerase III epsilon subunit family exonuclease